MIYENVRRLCRRCGQEYRGPSFNRPPADETPIKGICEPCLDRMDANIEAGFRALRDRDTKATRATPLEKLQPVRAPVWYEDL